MTGWDEDLPTLDEIHLTLDHFEDEIRFHPDGTAEVASVGIMHRCPPGTGCWSVTSVRSDATEDA